MYPVCRRGGIYANEAKKQSSIILNRELKDSSSKIIFDDSEWCAQFLNDYVPIFHFGRIYPEDIEDVSEQFVPLFENERNADSVKKINVRNGEPFYLLSIIEHKTQVDYNVSMQIFRILIIILFRFICTVKKNSWNMVTKFHLS